jgi:hypothetical protein
VVTALGYGTTGLSAIFSLGMDTLAEELKGHDVYTTVHSYSDWQTLADGAAADYKAGKAWIARHLSLSPNEITEVGVEYTWWFTRGRQSTRK